MQVSVVSILTGNINTKELDIDPTSYSKWLVGEDTLSNLFPNLEPHERDFLITGISDEEKKA